MNLVADCSRCVALCCVAPAFARSAEFAIDKAAGRPCPNLRGTACGIHDRLTERGFGGCVAYDCFGAGQQVVQVVFGGGARTPQMLRAYEVARQLHELLFYLADALSRETAAGPELAAARDSIEQVVGARPAVLEAARPEVVRAAVAPLLRRVSALSRAGRPHRDLAGRDLSGRDLAGADLRAADLSTAYLLGADLHGADLRGADLLGTDLRGADLRGTDLRDALYLTRTQVGGARTDPTTRLPAALRSRVAAGKILAMTDPAYLAIPVPTADRPGPWPGVVVVHDLFGMTDDIREQADWLAAAGYLAAVPDLYQGRAVVRCVRSAFGQLAAQQGPIFGILDEARTWLAASEHCTGTVGVIGYCMGGGFALLVAGRGWSAAGINYGEVPDNAADVLAGSCPLVGSYGGRDRSLPGAADKLRAAVPAGLDTDITEYPQARHGFLNRLAVSSPLVPMLKVAGVGYDHAAAADTKRRILAFFDTHLRRP